MTPETVIAITLYLLGWLGAALFWFATVILISLLASLWIGWTFHQGDFGDDDEGD